MSNLKSVACPVLSFAALVSLAAPTPAQDIDSFVDALPRTAFTSAPDDALALVECHGWQCRTNRKVGGGYNLVCITNTLDDDAGPLLVLNCVDSTWFGPTYEPVWLWPGESRWSWIYVPRNHTSWIQNWVVSPFLSDASLHELGYSVANTNERGMLVPTMAGTLQATHIPGSDPIYSQETMYSTGDATSSVSRTYEPLASGMRTTEDWSGAAGSPVNRVVTTTVLHDSSGFTLTCEVDAGKDGTIDHRSVLRYDETDNGDVSTRFEAFDGSSDLISSFDSDMTVAGSQYSITTTRDDDGDGTVDRASYESIDSRLSMRCIERDFDDDMDATTDRSERTTIESHGHRDSTMAHSVLDLNDNLVESYTIELSPTSAGYTMETLHDMNGDGVVDVRQARISTVAPPLGGMDQDVMGVDFGNDGVYEAFSNSGALKTLNGNMYGETVAADQDADGTYESITVRMVQLD